MKLAVVSHKLCWPSRSSPTGYATDGGFPFQMEAISELFDTTTVVVPSEVSPTVGLAPMKGRGMKVIGVSALNGRGFTRKLRFPFWILKNGGIIWREVRQADAVHTPIPGDIGTIGMLFALLLRKPLFVRHCGNWLIQRTLAERFWKWSMEYFAGGRNVMLATGGSDSPPSNRNTEVKWIFSTSLRLGQIAKNGAKSLPREGRIKLVIACRQEPKKGTDVVIESMPAILRSFPNATLDVIGDGKLLPDLKRRVAELRVEKRINFRGKLVHSEVLRLFKDCHLFCYPTSASEGFPKVVLEALANGLPVVTTRVSVLPQLIGKGCGVLLDSTTADELSTTVIDLCSADAVYADMSKMAIEISRKYSLEDWRDFIGKTLREAWGVSSLGAEV